MHQGQPHFTVYSSTASQWAGVPLLGLAEKGYPEGSYILEDVGLMGAGNFHPDYVKINRNGTIPSLTSPSLSESLIQSADILVYLNKSGPSGVDLQPKDESTSRKVQELIDLVHSDEVSTNIILFDARDPEEIKAKQDSPFHAFLSKRQDTLENYCQQYPENEFYQARRDGNGAIHKHYESSEAHKDFFQQSNDDYRGFAAGMNKLESLIVLPYAAGPEVTLADLHIVPWLAHALWGSGAQDNGDFDKLEALIQKTVPGFKIGPKTKHWWNNMMQRDSCKKVYPHPH